MMDAECWIGAFAGSGGLLGKVNNGGSLAILGLTGEDLFGIKKMVKIGGLQGVGNNGHSLERAWVSEE
jgi:hypothetical protein